jgi:hypothetical protein
MDLEGDISSGVVTNFNVNSRMVVIKFDDDSESEEIPFQAKELSWIGIDRGFDSDVLLVSKETTSSCNSVIDINNDNNENFNSNQLIKTDTVSKRLSLQVRNETALNSLHVTNEFEKVISKMNINDTISPSNFKSFKKKKKKYKIKKYKLNFIYKLIVFLRIFINYNKKN